MKKTITLLAMVLMCYSLFAQVEGALPSVFSVSDGTKVYFSKGNLQYTTTGTHACADGTTKSGTWRFAEHQYDIIGSANSNISSSYTGWIDLFGWSTSGWNDCAPYSSSVSYTTYYPNGSASASLTGTYANADWGVYNAISNGGNQTGKWRILTKDEWVYLFQTRTNATSLYFRATVNGQTGLVLLPDSWQKSAISETYKLDVNDFTTNVYSTTQWKNFENYGAIFLPTAGYRDGTGMSYVGTYGFYWSSTRSKTYYAYSLNFNSNDLSFSIERVFMGRSVRLVMDEEVYKYENSFVKLESTKVEEGEKVYAKNKKIVIENATSEVEVYDVMGRLVKRGVLTEVSVPASGVYVVRVGGDVRKVVVR